MIQLLVVGCSFHKTALETRERLAFTPLQLAHTLEQIGQRWGCEAVILSTCNRVELYLATNDAAVLPHAQAIGSFLAEIHDLTSIELQESLYHHPDEDAVRHLFRVASGLDSMIVGEGQIAGQVRDAYELASARGAAGPALHSLFQKAQRAAKRVRTETGIARGNISVASVAVAYVREVFDHFHDKIVLILGAGKMGELTLKHLSRLKPRQILVANRSFDKAQAVAQGCGGKAIPWEKLEGVLGRADIILSTTGASQPIVSYDMYAKAQARRTSSLPTVILDIAVPRDFDPRIHDGEKTFLFNIDDLQRVRDETLRTRLKHMTAADSIIEQELGRFLNERERRRQGPTIAQLTQDFEAKRREIVAQLLSKLNGKYDAADREHIEGAFRLLQNKFLHGPISALSEEATTSEQRRTLLEALKKLFWLEQK